MTDFESLMWRLEADPHLAAGFAAVTLLDRAPDLARLRARLADAATHIPQLRRRAVSPIGHLAPPEWRDDATFSIDSHLRSTSLTGTRDDAELCALAVEITHSPFDRERPLWEFVVIEGLAGGRAALLQKLHHTVTDGVGGVRLSERYLDITRSPATGASAAPSRGDTTHDDPASADRAPDEPGRWPSTTRALGHLVRRNLDAAGGVATATAGLATHPQRWPGAARTSVRAARSLTSELSLTERRRSPLWHERSNRFGLELLQVPLDDVRRSAHHLGGSVNDVFVAAAAGGAGAYHRALGHPVEHLRMAMPVSTRTDRSAAGNSFGVTRLTVPTGSDPVARFNEIHERLAAVRHEPSVVGLEQVAGLAGLLPTAVLTRVARQQVETVDFTTSNVRGAPFDLFVAGARVEANYPIGPLTGTAFNLTTLSYAGSLDMGLHVDRAAVQDPTLLRECIAEAFAELVSLRG
jgi:WS/DGAT/MGAT family acyltransferase